jgi:cold shock protein
LEFLNVTTIYGKVHFWNEEKLWGFIRRQDFKPGDKDDFVHISAVQKAGIRALEAGDAVSYELVPDKRRPDRMVAGNLKLI